jgi:hypothetical protein
MALVKGLMEDHTVHGRPQVDRLSYSHGGNTGSNPVGDAIFIKWLGVAPPLLPTYLSQRRCRATETHG